MANIIFFVVVTVFVAIKIYNALGKKDLEPSEEILRSKPQSFNDDKVITLKKEDVIDLDNELKKKYGEELFYKIKAVQAIDGNFSMDNFLKGAKSAFEIIVTAFSNCDKDTLRPLLGKDVYNVFEKSIDKAQIEGKQYSTTISAIEDVSVLDVMLNGTIAKITLLIKSEQINLVKDLEDKILEGNPSQLDQVTDKWSFVRDLSNKNPIWELVETS